MNISIDIVRAVRIRALQALLAATGILIQAGPASSQSFASRLEGESQWETIEVVEFGAMDLDVSGVTVAGPGVYEIRTRWRFADVQISSEGHPYRSSVAVRGVDCRRGMMALIAFSNQDGAKVVDEETLPMYAARWEPVAPESVVGRLASRVCEGVPTGAIAAGNSR